MCRVRKYFLVVCQGVKKGFSNKKCTFCFCLLCWRKRNRKYENMENENFKKDQKNSIFGWLGTKKMFLQNGIFWKIGKHYLCSEGKKPRIFVATICFWKMVLFWCPFKVTKHYKKRGFSRHGGKPKWHFWLQKCHFGEGASKGVYYLWYLKGALLKTRFL